MCSALSVVLTGARNSGGIIEDWVKRLRKSGPDSYLFDLPDGVRSSESNEDVTELSSTDLRMIARSLSANIYVYISSPRQSEGHWECYMGTHAGQRFPRSILLFRSRPTEGVMLARCGNLSRNHNKLNSKAQIYNAITMMMR